MTQQKGSSSTSGMSVQKEQSPGSPDGSAASPPTSPNATSPTSKTGRKQLPSVPNSEMQLSFANAASDKKATSPTSPNNTFGPFFLEYSLMAEYNQLQKQKLPGLYVIPSAKSPLVWFGVLFIRQGLYQEGAFRFIVHIPPNYPEGDCPQLIFDPPLFHPVIEPLTGALDVKRGFQNWRRNVNHIWHVLLYARRVFYKIETKNPLNPEAAVLYENDLEVFKQKVRDSINHCKSRLYEAPSSDDPHAIRFSEWDPELHEDVRKQMLRPKEKKPSESENAQTSGLTWMKKGSPQIFTKDRLDST